MPAVAAHSRARGFLPPFSGLTLARALLERKSASPGLGLECGALVPIPRENVRANTEVHQCRPPSSVLDLQQVLRFHRPLRLLLPAKRESRIPVSGARPRRLACEAR